LKKQLEIPVIFLRLYIILHKTCRKEELFKLYYITNTFLSSKEIIKQNISTGSMRAYNNAVYERVRT